MRGQATVTHCNHNHLRPIIIFTDSSSHQTITMNINKSFRSRRTSRRTSRNSTRNSSYNLFPSGSILINNQGHAMEARRLRDVLRPRTNNSRRYIGSPRPAVRHGFDEQVVVRVRDSTSSKISRFFSTPWESNLPPAVVPWLRHVSQTSRFHCLSPVRFWLRLRLTM